MHLVEFVVLLGVRLVEMAKSKSSVSIWGELLSAGLYKRNQGRLTRQLTAVALALIVFLGAWTLSTVLADYEPPLRLGFPCALAAVGAWAIFRAINYPRFADFLISVEAEMDKVSWSSRGELYRATVVVVVTMFCLGAVLFLFDVFWQNFFEIIRFLQITTPSE